VLLLGLAVVLDEPGLVAGTALGMFGLRLAAMRWLRRWELDHEVRLLREPLWRWTRTGPKGSRRGQRPSDPHGYYVEAQAVRR
jgi:hypothetical protein